eukprot:7468725-Lingulodinium_polyedra.AAC.1
MECGLRNARADCVLGCCLSAALGLIGCCLGAARMLGCWLHARVPLTRCLGAALVLLGCCFGAAW